MTRRTWALVLLSVLVATSTSATVYVNKATGNDANPGNGWGVGQAVATIQRGIDIAYLAGGDEVWVAQGTYNEQRTELWGAPASVAGSLVLKDNVHLYGGFDGTETARNQRAPLMAPTIIDGSTSRGGLAAYHVVVVGRNAGGSVNVIIDGFTITGGQAAGVAGDYHTWRGGGIYNWATSSLTVANCWIMANSASVSGGGVANEAAPGFLATATYNNCLIADNVANRNPDTAVPPNPIRSGGGVFVNGSAPVFVHCTITNNVMGNLAGWTLFGLQGGGIYGWNASVTMDSSIVWFNTNNGWQSEGGGGMTFTYCDLQNGVAPGLGNISANPVYVDVPFYRMLTIGASPCIDTANPGPSLTSDRGDVPRPLNGGLALRADMGCYEMSPVAPVAVCQNATVNLGAPENGVLNPLSIDGGSTAQAIIWRRTASQTVFACVDMPSKVVSLTVTDRIGRQATCNNATVTVVDNINPVAGCVAGPVTVNLSSPVLAAGAIESGSTDNCALNPAAYLIDGQPTRTFTCADIATNPNTVLLTVFDTSGNSNGCITTVNVVDDIPPIAGCVAGPITVNLSSPTLAAAAIESGSTDNCGALSAPGTWLIDGAPSRTFTCADIATNPNTVTLTVFDVAGNPGTCQTTVNVVDDVPPIAGCVGSPVIVNLSSPTLSAADIELNSTDNCGALSAPGTWLIDGAASRTFTCADIATNPNTVTLTIFDVAGNPGTCQTQVTVVDDIDPVAQCQNFTLDLDVASTVTFSDLDNGSSDNCGLNLAATTIVPDTFDCSDLGANAVAMTVFDDQGNSDTCNVTVTVVGSLRNLLQSPASYDLYVGDALPGVMQTQAECGVPPYTAFDWYFDADGFGSGNPAQLISNGLGGHPADPAITVTIGGASPITTLDLNAVSLASAGAYRSEVTDSDAPPAVTPSSEIQLNVYKHLAIIVDLPNDATANNGDTGFQLSITTEGGIPPLDYDWYYDDGGGPVLLSDGVQASGTTLSGTDTDTVSFDEIHLGDAGSYYCVVTDSGTPEVVSSNTVTLTITNFMSVFLPTELRAYTGYSPLSLTADVNNGFAPFTYTWYKDGGVVAGPQVGLSTLNLGTADASDIGDYYVVVKDNSGGLNPDATSNTCPVQVADAPSISVHPQDAYGYVGDVVGFSVVVVGGFQPYDYDWRINGFSAGAPSIPAIPSPPLQLIYDGFIIDVVVNDQGVNQVDPNVFVVTDLFSNQAVLHVSEPIVFDVQPLDVSAYTTDPAFDLYAHFTGGMEPMAYVWKQDGAVVDGPTAITTPNTITLTVDPAAVGAGVYDYNTEITDQVGTTSSDTAVVTIADPLTITDDLEDATARNDQPFEWSIGVNGGLGTVTIQWQKDDGTKAFINLADGGNISGTTTNTLSLDPAVWADAGIYRVEVSDANVTIYSSLAELTVVQGVPAVGVLGLAALAVISALSGAATLRRRK